MNKFIRIGSIDSELIPVIDIYPYIYESEKGKTVLRITIKDNIKTFEELKILLSTGNSIYEYVKEEDPEEIKLMAEHNNYIKEYKCNYNSDKEEFFIEITKKSDVEMLVEKNSEDIQLAYIALTEINEMDQNPKAITEIYCKLVQNGRDINSVPENVREAVKLKLNIVSNEIIE
jgi:hypothetical protein